MDTAQRNLDKLRIAIERFRRDCGRYPSNEEGLEALVWNQGLPGWKRYVVWVGPDPWGHQYFYYSTNGVAVVFSCGPDGQAGTSDDIAPHDPDPADIDRDQILGRTVSTETTRSAGSTSVVSETDSTAEWEEDEPSAIPVTVLPSKREGK